MLRIAITSYRPARSGGLLHGLDAFFGQSVSATMQQIGFAFLAGGALYGIRMAQAALFPAMMLTQLSGNILERTLNVRRPQPYRGRTRYCPSL